MLRKLPMLQRRPVRQAGPEATRTCRLGSFRLNAASSPKKQTAALHRHLHVIVLTLIRLLLALADTQQSDCDDQQN